MKILAHLAPLGVGGGSITMQQLLEELARRGHDIQVITEMEKYRTNKASMDGHELVKQSTILTVIEGPKRPDNYYKWADIVFTQLAATGIAMRLARAYRRPLVQYIHDRGKIKLYGTNRINTSLVIYNSNWLMKESKYPGIMVSPPVFPEKYRTTPGEGILQVALTEKKGVHLFYGLAKKLPDRHFVGLKGRGDNIIPDKLPANVEILESVPPEQMKEIYAKARIVLMPSRETKGSTWVESWGRVGIEAAASGIPCLASMESPGLRESLGAEGIFLPKDDVDAWADKIREMDNPEVYKKHSEYALQLSAMYDPRPQIDALEARLAEIVSPKKKVIEPTHLPKLPVSFNKHKRVDFFAAQRHFIDHMASIYHALPPEYRGEFIVNDRSLVDHASKLNIKAVMDTYYRLHRDGRDSPLVVAAIGSSARLFSRTRPIVLVNHGAGQSWAGVRHSSYAGGLKRNIVSLFIEPGDHPAMKDRQAYPRAKIATVGCSKLDGWHQQLLKIGRKPVGNPPVIAVSFHWHCNVVPETKSTLPHYQRILPELAKWDRSGEVKILGHGHPNPAFWKEMTGIWQKLGIEIVPDFDEVMERADVFVNDGMSTLYEFASLDRPVVVLNAPWYRRNVEHGLRFWECADVGVQVNEPGELIPAIKEALLDKPEQQELRRKAVGKIYKFTDGRATERAVKAILELL